MGVGIGSEGGIRWIVSVIGGVCVARVPFLRTFLVKVANPFLRLSSTTFQLCLKLFVKALATGKVKTCLGSMRRHIVRGSA